MDPKWPYVPRSVELWVKPEPDAGAGGVSEAAVCPVLDDLLPGPHTLEQIPPNNSHAAPQRMQEIKQEPSCEVVSIEHELRECRVVLERLPIAALITSNSRGSEDRDGSAVPVDRACVERQHKGTGTGNVGGDSVEERRPPGRSPGMAPSLCGENTDSGDRSPAMAPTLAVENTGSSVVAAPVPALNVPGAFCGTSPQSQNRQDLPPRRNSLNAEIVITDDTDSLDSCQNGCKSGDVLRELKDIKSFVTSIMQKVEGIEMSLARITGPAEPKKTLLPKLPLTQIKELEELEAMLRDENVRTELFDMLRHTGGSRERDCVNRCLEKVFSNYLGQYCSWTGKKNNYKLASLTLMSLMKSAVRQTFPNITDDSFERLVMSWFQHAGTRLRRL